MSHIRIESHKKVVTDAKVFFVNGDEEIDISACVQVVDLHLEVGAVATATLKAILGHARVTAQIEEIVTSYPPKRKWRGLWRRRRRWNDVTTVSDRYRAVS